VHSGEEKAIPYKERSSRSKKRETKKKKTLGRRKKRKTPNLIPRGKGRLFGKKRFKIIDKNSDRGRQGKRERLYRRKKLGAKEQKKETMKCTGGGKRKLYYPNPFVQ